MKAKKNIKKIKKRNRTMLAIGIAFFLLILTVFCILTQKNTSLKSNASTSYVSLVYYPGWVQTSLPPNMIDYTAWTHIMHFGMYPTTSGGVALADMQSTSYPPAAINAAHAAGKKIILVIGGEGQGSGFVGATKSTNLPTFVQNIVKTMKQYGYDGIDIDWEENVTQTPYVALLQQLRASLDTITPRPWLSADVDTGQHPPAIVAAAAPYLDYINIMTYWDNGTSTFSTYTSAGVPASKLVLGIGLSSGYFDQTTTAVQTKINYAKQQGMAGVMGWQIGDFKTAKTDPRLQPLRDLVALNYTLPTPTSVANATPTLVPSSVTSATNTPAPLPTNTPPLTPSPTSVQALTPPSNLYITNITAASVSMTWNASLGNVTEYTITRGNAKFANGVIVGTVTQNTLSFTDTTVSPRISYGYCVRAVDTAGKISQSSNCVKVTTPRR